MQGIQKGMGKWGEGGGYIGGWMGTQTNRRIDE